MDSMHPTAEKSISLLCKRWRDAAPLAWTSVKAIDFHNSQTLRTIRRNDDSIRVILRKCGASLRELDIGLLYDLNILKVVERYCRNLTKLSLDVVPERPGTKRLWLTVLQHRRLKYLKIRGRDEEFFKSVFNVLPRKILTYLHVLGIGGDFKHAQIFRKFSKLTAVTLESFSLSADASKVISYQDQLTQLSLINIQGTLLPLLIGLTNLEHLAVVSSMLVNDEFVIALSINNKKLRSLKLLDCFKISDRGIQALADLPELEELYLNSPYYVTDKHLGALCQLKKLDIACCRKIHDSGVIELVQSGVNLQYLNLRKTSVSENVLRAAADALCDRHTRLEIIVDPDLKKFWENYAGSFPHLIVNMPKHDLLFQEYQEKYHLKEVERETDIKLKSMNRQYI